ncbi:hypothetical protein [Streptomyces sp. ME19-01-6]|uniref:hypothetical protein n=1 Tax=Streptomyces sp. ME19-01-6 TaxID=3028686 RepID=UPI0029B56CDF|nr:hypothetical protein [Streptomyces sp. ME19-01-6]MDX3232910.1 hypothetical protein [Streptomyces sp. ME19-01-6]
MLAEAEKSMCEAIEWSLWQDLADFMHRHNIRPSNAPIALDDNTEPISRLLDWGVDPLHDLRQASPGGPWYVIDPGRTIHGGGVRDDWFLLRWETARWVVHSNHNDVSGRKD